MANGAGIGGLALLPFGPLTFLIGTIIGCILGLSGGLFADLIKLQKKHSLVERRKERLVQLIRWAEFNFAHAEDGQRQLLFKVLNEYQAVACLGSQSRTARKQLRSLYKFLWREDVQECLCNYLNDFFAKWKERDIQEIVLCSTVFEVCIQCCTSLRKPKPPIIGRMSKLLAKNAIAAALFSQAEILRRKERGKAVTDCDWVAYADAGTSLTAGHILKSDFRQRQFTPKDQTITPTVIIPERTSSSSSEEEEQIDSHKLSFPLSSMSSAKQLRASCPVLRVATLPADILRCFATTPPLEDLAKFQRGDISIVSNDQPSIDNDDLIISCPSSESIKPLKSKGQITIQGGDERQLLEKLFKQSEVQSVQQSEAQQQQLSTPPLESKASPPPPPPTPPPPPRLFHSLADLASFDTSLKLQTPIGEYELEFLDQLAQHIPGDKSWDCVVNKQACKVYKKQGDSPVILVKAYTTIPNVRPGLVAHQIRHIPSRISWDRTFEEWKLIEKNKDDNEVIYCMMRAPWPISNRDFLQWRRTVTHEDGKVVIMMRSASHPQVPERNGFVRAETVISGYIAKAVGNDTELFLVSQTDVKGMLPKWAVNQGAQKAPVQWTENLRKACAAYVQAHGPDPPVYDVV